MCTQVVTRLFITNYTMEVKNSNNGRNLDRFLVHVLLNHRIYTAPQCFFITSSYKFKMVIYSTLLCKKIARAPEGHKRFMLTKLGGGEGGGGRGKTTDPNNLARFFHIVLKNSFLSEYYTLAGYLVNSFLGTPIVTQHQFPLLPSITALPSIQTSFSQSSLALFPVMCGCVEVHCEVENQ